MQIIILHGEDIHRSYQRLTRFVDEAKKRSWEILYDDLSATPSLFGKERLIVLRDLKLINPKVAKSLAKIPGTLVVYSDRDMPADLLKLFSTPKVEKFDLPKVIWKFLDRPTVAGLHQVIKTKPIEFVFIMLFRTLKRKGQYKLIPELAQIDFDVKTGKADLLSSLDLLIAKHLE